MKHAVVFVGGDKVGSRRVPLPSGVGEATFKRWCAQDKWIETTDGFRVRGKAIVSFRIDEGS